MSAALRYSLLTLTFGLLACVVVALRLGVAAGSEMPHVEFNADNIGPRQIEELTAKSVPRDYGLAWQTMEQALEGNRPGLLDGYFTGTAKQDLGERVAWQNKSGMHTRYEDRGHKLEAIFYAPAGDAMQLRDRAQFDLQVLDVNKVIYEEPVNIEYIVLMTPGADRWMVRQMQAIEGEK